VGSNLTNKFPFILCSPHIAADEGHGKELMRLVKNVSLSRNKQLSILPIIGEEQNLNVFTDLDYCDDRDKRRSIPGYDIFCNEHQFMEIKRAEVCFLMKNRG
jgi:hypothetical protein